MVDSGDVGMIWSEDMGEDLLHLWRYRGGEAHALPMPACFGGQSFENTENVREEP